MPAPRPLGTSDLLTEGGQRLDVLLDEIVVSREQAP